MAILMGRKAGIFHVLSLTAFLMLLSRPAILFEAGFQLSFAAVAGIAGFQKPLSGMIQARGWLARSAWQLVSVSIAAQLATAPLSLFYFHQFSNVFIFSNLAVIPLATVILYVGLAFILLSSTGGYPLSGILEWLTSQLDGITRLMGRIPGAFMDDITLVPVQVFLLYMAIILAGVFVRSRKIILMHGIMLTFAMFLLVSGIRDYRVRSHEGFYVFSIPRESAISFVRGHYHSIYRGGRIRGDSLIIPYAIRNFSIRQKLSTPVFFPHQSVPRYACMATPEISMIYTLFKDRRILIIKKLSGFPAGGIHPLETDILVLVDNVSCNLDMLVSVFKPGLIIVDGSSHPWYHEKVERTCMLRGIPFHSTEKDGFYVY
jgi:competence protein ComEC